MIFLHPSSFLFLILLFMTIFMIISADSWLLIWLFLEINLLLFIPLIFSKKSKYQSEASIKYFINQAMSSVLILSSVTFLASSKMLTYSLLLVAFSLKMGVAPLHSWLVTVSSSISWFSLWLLLMPQKIAPMLITSVVSEKTSLTLFYTFIVTSSMVGALGALTTPSMKKIMAYSSIAQMGWLLAALTSSTPLWYTYFFIYFILTTATMLTLAFNKTNKMNDMLSNKNNTMKILMMTNMLAIAGLPPLSGFMMKLSLIMKIMETSKPFLLVPLIISSLISLYFYTRVFYTNLIKQVSKKQETHKNFLEKFIIFFNFLTLPLASLMIL